MREIRLVFSKEGNAKYIGHLDINRAMSRAFKRAKISLWYTEGYNPHIWMSFSLPLSLGVESICESVDIRLLDDISNVEVKSRMNSVLPPCIRIVDAYDEFGDCSEIMYSDYLYLIRFADNNDAAQKLKELFYSEKITVMKKAKQGKKRVLKETDIKPFIVSSDVSVRDDDVAVNVRLLAGTAKNLSPTLLFDAMIKTAGDYEWKTIKRIRLLDKNFKIFK